MRTSIIIKIFISFLLVSLLPIGALITYNNLASRRIVCNMKIEEIKKQTGKLAGIIDREISFKKERVKSLSNNSVIKRIVDKEIVAPRIKKTHSMSVIKQFFRSESAFIIDTNGEVVVASTHDIQIKNYGTRDFFKEAMDGNTYVSEPAMDQGRGYIYYSTPIRNYMKEVRGILVVRVQAEELWQLVEGERDYLGKESVCILTDKYGVRIAHATDRGLIFKSWVILDPEVKKKLEMEHHYGEDIKEIGFTNIPEVSKALTQSGGSYFIHPLAINTESNHGYCMPLEEKDWKLIYTVPASSFLTQIKHLTQNALYSTGIVFLVVIVATWLLSVSLLRPIKKLTFAANEIANGKLDHPIVNGQRQDEIGKLMRTFDIMRHKLKDLYKELREDNKELREANKEAQAQLIQAGKLAAIGELASGVAHEINNPLTAVMGYAMRLLRKTECEELKNMKALDPFRTELKIIGDASLRCKRITDSLLEFSRVSPELRHASINLNEVIDDTLILVESGLKPKKINLIKQLKPNLKNIMGDHNRLQQVCMNIINNAIHAMPNGGSLVIVTRENGNPPQSPFTKKELHNPPFLKEESGVANDDKYVEMEFTDTGCGIKEEHLSKIFDPFFTTREPGRGTGLGLSISYSIIKDHHGWIDVKSAVGKGTSFFVVLPVANRKEMMCGDDGENTPV